MLRARLFAFTLFLTTATAGLADPGRVELVSRAPATLASDTAGGLSGVGGTSVASADGRWFVFASTAPNLVAGQRDANVGYDIFLHDRLTGGTTLVSHAAGSPVKAGDRESTGAKISADGRWVVFASSADDLVPDGEEEEIFSNDVFLHERETGEIRRVGRGGAPAISADGGYIVFSGLHEGRENVFLFERSSGAVTLVSRSASAATRSGDGESFNPSISADGRFVAFLSHATDLVAGQNDPHTSIDVFLYDRVTGAMTLVSRSGSSALTAGNGSAHPHLSPSLSADGRFVAFSSSASNLVAGVPDDNGRDDAFLYDRLTGAMAFVSRASGSRGGFSPFVSADGGAVAYLDGPDGFPGGQVYVFDRLAGRSTLVSRAAGSAATRSNGLATSLSFSPNGRYLSFASTASNLVPGQVDPQATSDVFLHDRVSGATVLVSHEPGAPTRAAGSSFLSVVAPDGSWVAFSSVAPSLDATKQDTNRQQDVFLFERATATVRAVSVHPPGMASRSPLGRPLHPAISGDGRYAAFVHDAAGLFTGHQDANNANDVFLYDRVAKKTILVSRSLSSPVVSANSGSNDPRISRNGNFVAFVSRSTNLVAGQKDSPETFDVFLYNRLTGRVSLVSGARGSATRTANGHSFPVAVSSDGLVLFSSHATDAVPGQQDQNSGLDLFLHDPRTQTVALVSHAHGSAVRTGNREVFLPSASFMTDNGGFVVFQSAASDLLPAGQDTNDRDDVFVFPRRTGALRRLSVIPGTSEAAGQAPPAFVSANGRYAALLSRTLLDTEDGVVLLDRATGEALPVTAPAPFSQIFGLSDDGRYLLFGSADVDAIPGQEDTPFTHDVFLFDRVSKELRLVSHASGFPLRAVGGGEARLSADGRYVAFASSSPELVPGPERFQAHVFLFDRVSGDITLVDRSIVSPERAGNREITELALSAFGGYIAFISRATDLVPGDFNGELADVFLYSPDADTADAALEEKAVGTLTTVRSCTLLDTRRRKDGPALRSDELKLVRAHVRKCGIPETAKAVSLQATVFQPTGQGNLRFYRGDLTAPSAPAAILRFQRGRTSARPVVVPVSGDCNVAVLPFVAGAGEAHVRLEVNGYFK